MLRTRQEERKKSGKLAMERKEARFAIMELANMISVPMSLLAVINLNIPDIIWQSGANTPLTPSQILSKLTNGASADPQNLQRLLRMLASYDVFVEHSPSAEAERSYSLSEIGKTLVGDEEGLSHAAYVLQHHQEAMLRAWPWLHESVLDPSVEPFARANGGLSAYQYYGEKPEMNDLMRKAMSGVSAPFMKAMLEGYAGGFEGVERLVDVGGSSGACLKMIMERNPQVKEGINFDRPEVVARAPPAPGTTLLRIKL
ncbi:Nicotinate N-methyltransferase 1 [Asimina triloba]